MFQLLNRYRAQFIPPLPVDIDDVDISGERSRTRNGYPFFNKLDNHWGIAVFTTSRLLRKVAECSCIYLDGTFKTAPYPYLQFYTIHGMYHGFVVPLVFCLVTGKTTAQYRQIFQHLKNEIHRLVGVRWNPGQFVLDFEQAMITAIETELPRAKISCCYFHFTQSLWRHIQNQQLTTAYRNNRRLRMTVRKVMAIGYLPVLLVRQNFDIICTSRRTQNLAGRFPGLADWLDYVKQTYINNNCMFPPPL